jgi:hypothetical protein
MAEQGPPEGRIVIDWQRLPPEYAEDRAPFAWQISMEPPGLSDEDAESLLRKVADSI